MFAVADASTLVLVLAQASTRTMSDAVNFAIAVPDLDVVLARVTAAGGTIVRQPASGAATGGVRVAIIKDPEGNGIEVIGVGAAAH